MTNSSKFFIALVSATALVVLAMAIANADWQNPVQFGIMLVITLVASRLKVTLPGLEGNLSVNLPFLLIAAVQFGAAEAAVLALFSTLVQSISAPMSGRKLVQMQFNCATIVLATAAAGMAYSFTSGWFADRDSFPMIAAAAAYLIVNVGLVSTIIGLGDDRSVLGTVGQVFTLSFPHFVLAAGVAYMITSTENMSWHGLVALLPIMFFVYRSYRRYFATRANNVAIMPMHSAAAAD